MRRIYDFIIENDHPEFEIPEEHLDLFDVNAQNKLKFRDIYTSTKRRGNSPDKV